MARALAIESLLSQICASMPNDISYHKNLLSKNVDTLPFLQTSLETFDSPKTTRATKKSPSHFLHFLFTVLSLRISNFEKEVTPMRMYSLV
jgi:hypothetical protein